MAATRRISPLLLLLGTPFLAMPGDPSAKGFETILEEDLLAHLVEIASPELEGRDSPSVGLERAADFIERALVAAGAVGGAADGGFRNRMSQEYLAPADEDCLVRFRRGEDGEAETLAVGVEAVALPYCSGSASGELVFLGFGITDTKERYDDLRGGSVKGKVALILEGEPRHRRLFEGEELTEAADVHKKVDDLHDAGVVGVLVVRRPPAEPTTRVDGTALEAPALGFRYSWARWNEPRAIPHQPREVELPAFEITLAAASRLLGQDVGELAATIDARGKPVRVDPEDLVVELAAEFRPRQAEMDNVVGLLRGSDPELAEEYVVLGAHYDHIGVDPWGRVGFGADDNGSGVAALLEIAEALAVARPRRSVLFAFFAAEEDGLIGSRWFCDRPPVPATSMVTMVNVDMLGRGEADELFVLGTDPNPELEDVLDRAEKLHRTRVRKVYTDKGRGFWERSDHYSFHQIGVPVLFFFENYPETKNPDYHTYRDAIESLDLEKVARSTRFVFNTTWLLANDDERPPAPR